MKTNLSNNNPFKNTLRLGQAFSWEILSELKQQGEDIFILDYGAYDGRMLNQFVKDKIVNKAISVDLNKDIVESNQSSLVSEHNLILIYKGEPLPFENEVFDCITMIGVLEHVFDVYDFVRECRRVLKPQGVLVIEVPNLAYFKHRIRLALGYLPVTSSPHGWADGYGWDGGHLHYFTKDTVTGLLTDEGFKVSKIMESRAPFAKQRSYWTSLLAGNFLIKSKKIK